MGGGDSKMMNNSTSYDNLDQQYVNEVRKTFAKTKKEMKRVDFESWQSTLGELAGSLFNAFSKKEVLDQNTFLEVSNKLRGDADEAATVLLKIHGSTAEILKVVTKRFAQLHNAENGEVLLQFLLREAPKDDNRLSNYLVSHPLAAPLIRSVYASLWNSPSRGLLPKLAGESFIITSACSLAVLDAFLPMERRHLWTLLFSSTQHGSSFAQLQKRISGEGPCLVVIKSTDNRVFGCFASEGFLSGPLYRGDATSFLFELAPEINVFTATGKISNYAYLNVQQSTLPNGLGIGGSEDIWPLFIHEEYGKGTCCRTVAFEGLPCLAGQQNFQIKMLEVWRTGLKRSLTVEEEERIRSPKSIIDKDPEAKALLEMSGHQMHSEAYREPAPMLDNEEEWR